MIAKKEEEELVQSKVLEKYSIYELLSFSSGYFYEQRRKS